MTQVIDSGLDEESCFFTDGDGDTVERGYFFEEIAIISDTSVSPLFTGGYFPHDPDRRKVARYVYLTVLLLRLLLLIQQLLYLPTTRPLVLS